MTDTEVTETKEEVQTETNAVDYNALVEEFGWVDPEVVTYSIMEGEDGGVSVLANVFLGGDANGAKGLILDLGHYYEDVDQALEWIYQHTLTEEFGLEVDVWDEEGNQKKAINLTEWVEEYYE